MSMNLPNKLTIARVILILPFVIFLLLSANTALTDGTVAAYRYIAAAIFIVASLTDMLDGKIARKYNLVTNFGKFMDPLADKLLVSAALICLIETGQIASWIVILIISREFIISGFRLIASDKGIVIAAGWWGKIKTVVQMITIILLILDVKDSFVTRLDSSIYHGICLALIYLSLALTVISLVDYVWANRKVLSDDEEPAKEAPEEGVAKRLMKEKLSLATAESCTGGLLSGRLVNVPGISEVLKEGYITYSNEAKERLLGVSSETLKQYGAVSEETAREMARGAAQAAGTDIGIAVTGIAGPDGGTLEKPVGLVYISCYYKGKIQAEKHNFTGDRSQVRESSVQAALTLLKEIR